MQSTLIKSLARHIDQSQREVTILFTDIEDSTRFWGNRGNIEGRLMVDRHNRLLLPLVRQFHGKVIKTIGDSVMAMFNQPADAIDAAIAMQQALQQVREEDRRFRMRVRIGLHIGEGIVEHNDVYGDVVNIAARIECEAQGDEILISGRLARRLDKSRYRRRKQGSFIPKGKNRAMALYHCDWQQHEDLLAGLERRPALPLGGRQRVEMLGYTMALLATLTFLHLTYLRYLLADQESLALLALNPGAMLGRYGYLTLLLTVFAAALLWRALRIKAIPQRIFKTLKGAATAGLLFMLLHSLNALLPADTPPGFDTPLYQSHHLFVEVLADEVPIYDAADEQARALRHQQAGTLLLLSDVLQVGDTVWNKVLLGDRVFGWIKRIQPPRLGVAERRISRAQKFTLRYGDIAMLLLALPGFLWGYRSFHLRPL